MFGVSLLLEINTHNWGASITLASEFSLRCAIAVNHAVCKTPGVVVSDMLTQCGGVSM